MILNISEAIDIQTIIK